MWTRKLVALFIVMALAAPMLRAEPAAAAEWSSTCFTETTFCIKQDFKAYWEQNGAVAVFGFPIAPQSPEYYTGDTADELYLFYDQWFERNRLEYHEENAGTPYEVLLGLLGKEALERQGRDWQSEPRESGPKAGCLWFEQTGHNVCDQTQGLGFKTYWESHGLSIPGLNRYERSLQLFGLPLTEPKMETNENGDTVLTQWFERARFEWHPNNPNEYKVLLGLLGKEINAWYMSSQTNGQVFAANGFADIDESARFLGEVVNQTGGNVFISAVYVRIYDVNNRLIDVHPLNHWVYGIRPDQRSPFVGYINDEDLVKLHHRHEIDVRWHPTETVLQDVVKINSYSDRPNANDFPEYDFQPDHLVEGSVTNTSDRTISWALATITTYDAQGRVTNIQSAEINNFDPIPPGATFTFKAPFWGWNNDTVTGYRVQINAPYFEE